MEKSFALSELAARISLARLLASMSFASGWKDEGKSADSFQNASLAWTQAPCLAHSVQ